MNKNQKYDQVSIFLEVTISNGKLLKSKYIGIKE
jgi:hypothetical protein